jgi:RNA polymerase sigma-70 factor (ECF subfamily)
LIVTSIDTKAYRKLFEDYYNLICNYLNAHTNDWELSQEIAQKTFVKFWEKRDNISFTTSAKSYLFQSARNTLIDYYRAQKNFATHSEKYTEEIEKVTSLNLDEEEEGWRLKQKIAWAVQQLKPKTREIFLLNKQEGLTYEEIASYLKISKRTVEYNMKNALVQLRELLKDHLR